MNTISRTAVLAAIVSLNACATESVPSYRAVEHVDTVDGQVTTAVDFGDEGGVVEVPGSICECDSHKCVEQWVLDNYGCGLCIDAVCDGEAVGGCVFCDGDAEAPPPPHEINARDMVE